MSTPKQLVSPSGQPVPIPKVEVIPSVNRTTSELVVVPSGYGNSYSYGANFRRVAPEPNVPEPPAGKPWYKQKKILVPAGVVGAGAVGRYALGRGSTSQAGDAESATTGTDSQDKGTSKITPWLLGGLGLTGILGAYAALSGNSEEDEEDLDYVSRKRKRRFR